MGSIAKLFTIPSKSQERREQELAIADAAAIREQAKIEQEAILQDANASAEAAEFNAGVLRRNAVLAVDTASINEARTRKIGRKLESSQRVAIAASGFTSEGFEDLIADSASEDALDALLIRREGKLAAENFLTQASLALRGGGEALEAGATRIRASATSSSARQRISILTGENRARAARERRRTAIIDAGVSIASDLISPSSSLTRLTKVLV